MKKVRNLNFLLQNGSYAEMDSPVGSLALITSPKGLHAILWDNELEKPYYQQIIQELNKIENEKTILQTQQQLNEYFSGDRQIFNLPLVIEGTDFQIMAWNELLKIPYSTTISYATQAMNVGDRNKARAIGAANGANPIPIIIPCHRVVGSNNNLVGFAGGIDKKDYLIKLERELLNGFN